MVDNELARIFSFDTEEVPTITLEDVVLYGLEKKPAKKYSKVVVAGKAVQDFFGRRVKGEDGMWVNTYRPDVVINSLRKKGESSWRLPSLPLLYAIIERLYDDNNPALNRILKEAKVDGLLTSSHIDYSHLPRFFKDVIVHDYDSEEYKAKFKMRRESEIINVNLAVMKQNPYFNNLLQILLMPKDVDKAVQVLAEVTGKVPYLLTPYGETLNVYTKSPIVFDARTGEPLVCVNPLFSEGAVRLIKVQK